MTNPPDAVILVYDGDSGLRAIALDVLKKAVGREDCALCEITNSPVGKRRAWAAYAKRLGVVVSELHRDELPAAWNVERAALPCVLRQRGGDLPMVLLTRDDIIGCQGRIDALEERLQQALAQAVNNPRAREAAE